MGVFRRVEASLVPYGHVNYTQLQTGLLCGLKTPPVQKSMLQDVLWHASAASEGTFLLEFRVHGPSLFMAKTACNLLGAASAGSSLVGTSTFSAPAPCSDLLLSRTVRCTGQSLQTGTRRHRSSAATCAFFICCVCAHGCSKRRGVAYSLGRVRGYTCRRVS